MKSRSLMAACALALSSLSLASCGTTGVKVLSNLSADCYRKYDGTIAAGITGGQFTGTVQVECLNASLAEFLAAKRKADAEAKPGGLLGAAIAAGSTTR